MKKRISLALLLPLLLTGCGNAGTACTGYVQAVMDCTYTGDTAAYIRCTKADEAAAQKLHEDEIAYVSALLAYNASVDTERIAPETAAQFDAAASALLGKAVYTVDPAVRTGENYQITVNAAPLDLWETALPELEKVYSKEFAEHFYKAPPGGEEYDQLEAKWGERAAEVLTEFAEQTTAGEPQAVTVTVTVDAQQHYVVADTDWRAIDAVIFGGNS